MTSFWIAAALVAAAAAEDASPTPDERRSFRAAPAGGRIQVDGVLDEPGWRGASPAGPLRQKEPTEGAEATDATDVRVLFDDHHLYVGIECAQDPASLNARAVQRDTLDDNEDGLVVLLDTFLDRRNCVAFGVNPLGTQTDLLCTNEGADMNILWDGIWTGECRRDEKGWTAELAIPLSTLRFPAHPKGFGFNVMRLVRSKNEFALWTAWRRDHSEYRVSVYGTLEGIESLVPQRPVMVKPYLLGGADREPVVGSADEISFHANGGADAKIGLTGGLTADLTANTDFSQVDADDVQINLSRFSLFFPEKREFFLEGAGTFRVGGDNGPLLFHSRRIGLSDSGELVPILGGLRVTGREGPVTIGLLDMMTAGTDEQPRLNYAVARARLDVFGRSSVGVLGVHRARIGGEGAVQPNGEPFSGSSGLAAVDGDFKFGENGFAYGSAAATPSRGLTGDNLFLRAGGGYGTDFVSLWADLQDVRRDFNPEVGFLSRGQNRSLAVGGELRPRPEWDTVRQVPIEASYVRIEDSFAPHAWQSEYASGTVKVIHDDGSVWDVDLVSISRENVTSPFDIGPDGDGDELGDLTVPAGAYTDVRHQIAYETDSSRPISGDASASFGGFLGGSMVELSSAMVIRFSPRWSVTLRESFNDIRLPGGSFHTNLFRVRLEWNLSRSLYTSAYAQVNSETRTGHLALRLRWRWGPASDLFLVVNAASGPAPDAPHVAAVAKLTYAFLR